MQQVNPETCVQQAIPPTASSIKAIVIRVLLGYILVTLIVDLISMVHGCSIISDPSYLPDEVVQGRVWLITTTVFSFFLGAAIIITIGLKKRYMTIALGIVFIVFVFAYLYFVQINYSLIGLAANAIITLISVVITILIQNWKRF